MRLHLDTELNIALDESLDRLLEQGKYREEIE